ncbi:hypothetical protein L596_010468 [Steinernema carpocapsae]|uniref:6-phosphofructo-2-kinase domain-containing protein n=2 Tax=Steinernema carpocapsae TaxID=34508 RepID=A0A4U5PIZ4_STECR|nr:hypothetical protein L596_010468 [Steinernema carpocapsae]
MLACSNSSREQVRVPNVIALVGLPARGKTYISHKLCRYLNWIGIKTRAFNVGEYRRKVCNLDEQGKYEFFNPNNKQGTKIRDECAKMAMEDMGRYLQNKEGEVAIFDATNTTRKRRRWLVDYCQNKEHDPKFRVFFIESVCDDPEIINSNIAEVKVSSPDYKGHMTEEAAKDDFLKRIENYKSQYEPLDESLDDDLSFIKVINAGRSFYVHNVNGHVQSRVVYFLMNIHLLPRSIYLTRLEKNLICKGSVFNFSYLKLIIFLVPSTARASTTKSAVSEATARLALTATSTLSACTSTSSLRTFLETCASGAPRRPVRYKPLLGSRMSLRTLNIGRSWTKLTQVSAKASPTTISRHAILSNSLSVTRTSTTTVTRQANPMKTLSPVWSLLLWN